MKSPYISLEESSCRHCLKCVRACPTGAMSFNGGTPMIADEDCILCGRCYSICAHGAQHVSGYLDTVLGWLQDGEEVVLSVDPAFAAIWPDFNALKELLIQRGFSKVEETARGAAVVSAAYAGLTERGEMKNIITTNCPVVNALIEREYPELIEQMAPVAPAEIVHARMIREEYPSAKVVFVTPCIASFREIKDSRFAGLFDICVPMEELDLWIRDEYKGSETKEWGSFDGSIARMYPTCGGIIRTLEPSETYKYIAVDGIGRIRTLLNSIRNGDMDHCFIEASACRGSCIAGPLNNHYEHNEWFGQQRILNHMHPSTIKASDVPEQRVQAQWQPAKVRKRRYSPQEIAAVMRYMGKEGKDKVYDCGACGYNTCREKAEAVLMGRADPKLCIPELLSQAESMASAIIEATPNGIIVFNEQHEVTEMNKAAKKLLKMTDRDVTGMSVHEVFPTGTLAEAVTEPQSRTQYSENWYECYGKLFYEVVLQVRNRFQTVVILMDRTAEEARIREISRMREHTLKVTQDVIDAQMRTVQEIASLLGETTAKSKIALLNLQRVMDGETNNE